MKRYKHNPIIIRDDIPGRVPGLVDVSSVFNPGAVWFDGKILLLLRVQNRGRETFLIPAVSEDGISFSVADKPATISGLDDVGEKISHVYDPRITHLDGRYYVVCAIDCESGCRLGLFVTVDFNYLEFLRIISPYDSRNGVIFPEKIGGRYMMLERPNISRGPDDPPGGTTITAAVSDDLLVWQPAGEVMRGRAHYWDELIGSGPPPVKTRRGWLHIYHGIATHFSSVNIYQAGVVLLDEHNPTQVIARSRQNILEPREPYELTGQVPNVVFPSGMIVFDTDDGGYAADDSRVYVYYGAADTSVGLAMTTVGELIAACHAGAGHE